MSRRPDTLKDVEPTTTKAQLRERIRAGRAARLSPARDRGGSGAEAARTASAVTAEARHRDAPRGADLAAGQATVADSGLALIARLWPSSDLTGRTVVAYAALTGEPDLDPVIDALRHRGARVFLPVVTRLGDALRFGEVTEPMAALTPHGKWGIREPAPQLSATELISVIAPDLIFVPALGFASDGARLGNGGGFYDRTFGPRGEVALTSAERVIGVCFAEETDLPALSVEPWDLRIAEVLTEEGLHTVSAASTRGG